MLRETAYRRGNAPGGWWGGVPDADRRIDAVTAVRWRVGSITTPGSRVFRRLALAFLDAGR